MLIDSHCHLNFPDLVARLPEVLANMHDNNIRQALAISVSRDTYAQVQALADAHANIYCTIGVHPDEESAAEFSLEEMIQAASLPKVVGIGETGLDYHWCQGDLTWQHQRFRTHIQASNATKLPLVVHTRDAGADTLRLLREERAEAGVIHCFTEDVDFAREALDLGFYISFSGILTFKNAQQIQAAAQFVPQDRILVETDAPYLAPVPKRGKPNEPAYVRYTADFLAQLRGDSVAEVERYTCDNFYRLFNKVPRIDEAAA
ncbi:TatD family hydrolase [Vitreoscilla massiliensis]|uniref:TatD family hydrolase n=1 Tax=Vitreoscilla massiliensis TaxID=1689272 RepID=A0ABY4DYF8_9NEIS|nr:TatD family hydrolase [Vitreoscilla massiliensis]UOO88160.1 TatD family hydrolase [Vitreoscilla massiliensis]